MKFTTGEIITAGTGKMCCPIERVYVVLNFLTGDNLYTHQLPRAFRACEKWVNKQHPWLSELNIEQCNRDTWKSCLANAESLFGCEHELKALPKGQWQSVDPVQEAIELMEDKDRIIAIQL